MLNVNFIKQKVHYSYLKVLKRIDFPFIDNYANSLKHSFIYTTSKRTDYIPLKFLINSCNISLIKNNETNEEIVVFKYLSFNQKKQNLDIYNSNYTFNRNLVYYMFSNSGSYGIYKTTNISKGVAINYFIEFGEIRDDLGNVLAQLTLKTSKLLNKYITFGRDLKSYTTNIDYLEQFDAEDLYLIISTNFRDDPKYKLQYNYFMKNVAYFLEKECISIVYNNNLNNLVKYINIDLKEYYQNKEEIDNTVFNSLIEDYEEDFR